jgi:NTE family protein
MSTTTSTVERASGAAQASPHASEAEESNSHASEDAEPVAVVFSGAGARGAYEAGMMSVLLPALEQDGLRPSIFVGTSAGAINAALFASLAHVPATEAARRAVGTWRKINKAMVIRPAAESLPLAGLRYVASILGAPGELRSLLDTTPLLHSLNSEELMDWVQLHHNLLAQNATMLAVVTTEFGTGRTKVFVEGALTEPSPDDDRAIDYVRTILTPEHILASSAIPVAFPPVRLGSNEDNSWHMDGGVRLNAPLKPAITLGAQRLVVISTDVAHYRSASHNGSGQLSPSLQDSVEQVMRGAMGDRMIEDLNTLARTNLLLDSGGQGAKSATGREYQVIPFLFGGPPVSEDIGAVAEQALADRLHGLRALWNADLGLLRLLLSSGPNTRGDLVSYLFFEPEFIDRAIAIGQEHAELILRQKPLWHTDSF